MIQEYISKQKASLKNLQDRIEVAEKISDNIRLTSSLSDHGLRAHHFKKENMWYSCLNGAEAILIHDGPHIYSEFKSELQEIRMLRNKMEKRSMTEEEFGLVDGNSPEDLIHSLYERRCGRKSGYILRAGLAYVDHSTYQ